MIKKLFHHPRVISRHANAPMAEERNRFLSHLASRGTPLSTLLRYARQLRVIAGMMRAKAGRPVTLLEIGKCARRWARQQQRQGRARTLKWSMAHFQQAAGAWFSFLGQLEAISPQSIRDAEQLEAWLSSLRSEAQLSEGTTKDYEWWIRKFLEWLQQEKLPVFGLTLTVVDKFIEQLAARGLSRISLAKAATVLRRFLRYAFERNWCRRDLSESILSPRIFRFENLPVGPSWADVRRIVTATEGSSGGQLRNRAILLLLSVYGLRSGEVRCLCLRDLDWDRRILRVHRTKTSRVQEYPLTAATGQALRRYLKKARPASPCPELFLTLRAPYRQLSAGALCDLVRSLMERLEIRGSKRGPHALRHACATYLLNQGFSLKKVGDHLGHRSLSATQIYAKVDLNGLRAVAEFDLGGLL